VIEGIRQQRQHFLAFAVGLLLLACAAAPATAGAMLVLGSKKFYAPIGEGWGTAEPKRVSNGGVPSGIVDQIHWKNWGGPMAIGWGRSWIYEPRGGYYDRSVRVKLRALDIGDCAGHRAYRHLSVRKPSRPGGKLGPWASWTYRGRNLCDSH
jgi:hypothetical protein